MEVIDGQQRLTTLMLLLRAFYEKYGSMQNDKAIKTSKMIEQCIWKTDEFGDPDKTALKINSEVATDNEKEEFLDILKTGDAADKKSRYAANYKFFQEKIISFLNDYPDFFSYLPIRLLNNCVLLPIEAESQDTALRIFSTLNDRGKPLSDADIFKAQFYKYFNGLNKKDRFINDWKDLEVLCNDIFHPTQGTPMDELFTRYMYYERAKQGIKLSTTEGLRKFYEKNAYALLKNETTFNNLVNLAEFWKDVLYQNSERFSDRILRRLYVLTYAPNGMWTYILSVYYMVYKDDDGQLEEDAFYTFLNKIIGFIWTYAVTNPGVNALRTPFFAEMVNLINKKPVQFEEYHFDVKRVQNAFKNYYFSNNRRITKSMLAWWAYESDAQQLLSFDTTLEIEHIFSRKRQEMECSLSNNKKLEALGNKILLEKRINIRASDYHFADKIKYYNGFINSKKQQKDGSKIYELSKISTKTDFKEKDIDARTKKIIYEFINYLSSNHLLK